MIIVSDTSPLNYLILIGKENILPKLFGQIIIPNVVFEELQSVGASDKVSRWANNLPDWVEIRQTTLIADELLDILDAGERGAILLAQELTADLLLVDDRQARQAANALGINITGTIGILDKAASEGLIELRSAIAEIQKTNFRIADVVVKKLIEENEKCESREKFLNTLSKVPKVEPDEADRID